MKLSDAMMLGRPLMESLTNRLYFVRTPNGCVGCALGCGLAAVGAKNWKEMYSRWAWLTTPLPTNLHHPRTRDLFARAVEPEHAITHLFGLHLRGEISFEEIADWVRSVEPPDEQPVEAEAQAEEVFSAT